MDHEAQVATIEQRARRMAIDSGFTGSEYQNASIRCRSRWESRAFTALQSEGMTFDPVVTFAFEPLESLPA